MKRIRYFLWLGLFSFIFISNNVIAQLSSFKNIGGFEDSIPSYWTKGNTPSGATLDWATDQFHSMGRSLKITKTATSDSAAWVSENMLDLWSPQNLPNVDILVGAYVKTQNVNTNPTGDDQKWYIAYTFYDSTGVLIGQTKLPINQSQATSNGWIADTNGLGETILDRSSWKTIISFVGGKNASGTVWADDFILTGRNGKWAGQDWNTSVGVPTGWNYWLPPNGGNDAKLSDGYENTRITNEAAHSGTYSLKFDSLKGTHDAWVGTKRTALGTDIKAGDVLRISVWIKASNLVPDSAAKFPGTWSVGITPIFHSGINANDPYDEIGAKDLVFTFPNVTQFDWTQYYVFVTVPNDPKVKSLSVRLHVYSRFKGTIYFDDVEVLKDFPTEVVAGKDVPVKYELMQNYPNPFNPSTTISYTLPERSFVKIVVYDMLGREIKTLINSEVSSGSYRVVWNGDNNAGMKVASGAYIYRIEAGKFILAKKMLLLK